MSHMAQNSVSSTLVEVTQKINRKKCHFDKIHKSKEKYAEERTEISELENTVPLLLREMSLLKKQR